MSPARGLSSNARPHINLCVWDFEILPEPCLVHILSTLSHVGSDSGPKISHPRLFAILASPLFALPPLHRCLLSLHFPLDLGQQRVELPVGSAFHSEDPSRLSRRAGRHIPRPAQRCPSHPAPPFPPPSTPWTEPLSSRDTTVDGVHSS